MDTAEVERLSRSKVRAIKRRDIAVTSIRAIHHLSLRVINEPTIIPKFKIAASKLELLWTNFKAEDESVLDYLVSLNLEDEFSDRLQSEVSDLISDIEVTLQNIALANAILVDGSVPVESISPASRPRLPEIPLPTFAGDFHEWPTFRDRFYALVNDRPHLTNIDKMYYLLGCLSGLAAEAIRSIPISAVNYELTLKTLIDRFDKPRMVATTLVEKLLTTPNVNHESLSELNNFVATVSESISLLESLNIPDIGSFLLFTIASRCLPISIRKLYEGDNSQNYPVIKDLLVFLKSRISILETISNTRKSDTFIKSNPQNKFGSSFVQGRKPFKQDKVSLTISKPDLSESKCKCCNGAHALENCNKFKSWSVSDRQNWIRGQRCCFLCFSSHHWSNKCKVTALCRICSRRHHILLHIDIPNPGADTLPTASTSAQSVPASLLSGHGSPSVILGTALVHMRDRSGLLQTVRVLIDSASQINAVTSECIVRLGLRITKFTAPVTGLSKVPVPGIKGYVNCQIRPRFSVEPVLKLKAWVLPTITSDLPRQSLPSSVKDKYSHLALADPFFDVAAPVDLLLGADLFSSIIDGRQVSIDKSLPAAFSSIFGWVLIGTVLPIQETSSIIPSISLTASLEHLVDRFWHTEEPDPAPMNFTQNGQCEMLFSQYCTRLESGRFLVPLPFRTPISDAMFEGSRGVAVKRFLSLERKLESDSALRLSYNNFMSEYLSLGHMSIASTPGQFFIPHHAVFKADVNDGKIRVVFDASAQTSTGLSLNQCLFCGPKLQQDIVDIITRFRVFRHAFTSDICKMYRQILVLPEFRKFQHILWRPSTQAELIEYELNTVTYGINCAPFLALRVLQAISEIDCDNFPLVKEAICNQTYVDDICCGADTVVEACSLQSDLITVLSKSGFELSKWSSNTPDILEGVSTENRASGSLSFNDVDNTGTKVLGLYWHPLDDSFKCDLNLKEPPVFTKRGILSLTARFFDPLGFFAPSIFLAKCIIQRAWQASCSWDDPIPPDIQKDWSRFVSELPALTNIRVPRYFNTKSGSLCYLFGFCDASQRGYAAVIYLHVLNAPRASSTFIVGSKTKLAPIKSLTIPRLELNAALLLARWMKRVRLILCARVTIVDTFAWTDSLIVLSWLTVPHDSFKQYVSNRVHQIHNLLPDCQWRYVTSATNPADCASRGLMPSELPHFKLYWHGPEFIYSPPCEWGSDIDRLSVSELPEIRAPVSLTLRDDVLTHEWYTRFSSFDNMLRVVAWINRFVSRCRDNRSTVLISGPPSALSRLELDEALHRVVLRSQLYAFAELRVELLAGVHIRSKPIARLCPFIDDAGVIRVGGRLRHSSLPYEHRHPILLSKSSHLSLLICRHWHKITCHSGPRVMSALIGQKFWIMSLRSVIYSVTSQCIVCLRFDGKHPQPIMADLPAVRVQQVRPFTCVGVDYAGPLQMRELQLRKSRTYKIYIAIFICLGVKAVHLEVVTALSTQAFLAAFDRFIARRGLPGEVYSDCGTNFVGAATQLRKLINNNHDSQQLIMSSNSSCTWHFNPPSAPHFGGIWEAAVRSTKRLLSRIVGPHTLTYEEFTTVLCRVEAVLNSRPLTPKSTDPHDLECITPGHFIIGQPLLAIPPRSSYQDQRSLVNRWKLLEQCHQSFWHRWSTEYLNTLQERSKWVKNQPNVKLGDMVLIRDNQASPLEWRLGRITSVVLGADGNVRVVDVQTSQGIITRPVVKLIVLPTK